MPRPPETRSAAPEGQDQRRLIYSAHPCPRLWSLAMPDPSNPAPQHPKHHAAPEEEFAWLIEKFVSEVAGVQHVIVVSSDGVLLTASRDFPAQYAEQLAAITGGLHSLAEGTAQMFGKGETEQVLLRMQEGHLLVM